MPRKKKSSSSENHRSASASSVSINKDKPVQRNAANARERARMRVLSRAFCRLKTTLPWVPADTKLSKLDTLRLAASYIAHLKGILDDDPFGPDDPIHPAMNLTWPFGFNRGGGNGSGGGGSGSEDAEESGSSCAWEEVTKDCVHLDPEEDDPSLHLHHLNSSSQLHHLTPNSNSTPSHNHTHSIDHNHNHHGQNTGPGSENGTGTGPGNGNVIPFNPQHSHHQHPQSHMIPSNSMIPCYHDDIMSIG